jgi:hypothetical protein
MRFMVMVKASEQAGPPPQKLLEIMGKEAAELTGAGTMLDTGGLLPSAAGGTRIRLSQGRVSVTDGPFTEAKELVGGYAILQVASREEAVDLGTRLIRMHKDHWPDWEGEAEIRQIADAEGA